MKSRSRIGSWLEHTGQLVMFAVFLVCLFDLYGFSERGHLLISLPIYLSLIFSGVILHIVASPVKQIQTTAGNKMADRKMAVEQKP